MIFGLNKLRNVDVIFFIIIAALIVIAIAIYFLIPVFNHKQYQEQRDNLRKREAAFKASTSAKKEEVHESAVEEKE